MFLGEIITGMQIELKVKPFLQTFTVVGFDSPSRGVDGDVANCASISRVTRKSVHFKLTFE
jgi:hypothetical protein